MALIAFLIICYALANGATPNDIFAWFIVLAVGYVVVQCFATILKVVVYIIIGMLFLFVVHLCTTGRGIPLF